MSTPNRLPTFVETEPVTSLAVGFSLIFNSVLLALPLFDIALSWDQALALAGIFNSVLAVITLVQRSQVTPAANAVSKDQANAAIKDAFDSEPGIGKPPLIP